MTNGAMFDLYAVSFAAVCGFITLIAMWWAERVHDLPYKDVDCPDEIEMPSHIRWTDAPIDWKMRQDWVD